MDSTPPPVPGSPDDVVARRFRQNALVLFVLFTLQPIAFVLFIAFRMAGSTAFSEPYFWIRDAGVIGGLYSLFFLPTRWRVIGRMPPLYRYAALIGAGGLVLFFLLELPGIWGAL